MVPTHQPPRYVPLDRVLRKHNKKKVRKVVEQRNQAIAVATALAEGEDAAEVVDDGEDTLSSVDGADNDAVNVGGEIAAASVHAHSMYYSSCSEDEEVLLHTLRVMRHQSALPGSFEEDQAAAHVADTDDETENRKRRRVQVPDTINSLFPVSISIRQIPSSAG